MWKNRKAEPRVRLVMPDSTWCRLCGKSIDKYDGAIVQEGDERIYLHHDAFATESTCYMRWCWGSKS
jgi:hypothetical protein